MKILAIISSHRKKGTTSKMVSILKDELESIGRNGQEKVRFESIFLSDYQILRCKGCRLCFDHGEENCPLKDDVLKIRNKIKDADGIIFAGPVYVGDVDSTMKGLIDRLAFICHRPELYDKIGLIICTTGGTTTGHTINTIKGALYSWGICIAGSKGFATPVHASREELSIKYIKNIKRLADKVYIGIKKKKYLNPSIFRIALFKLRQKYWRKTDPNTCDYNYYEKQGWIDTHKTYYFEHQANMLKIVFGSIICKLLDWIIVKDN